ncbi:MAG: O-antigen ligase family protein [Armatimonadota bacterium]
MTEYKSEIMAEHHEVSGMTLKENIGKAAKSIFLAIIVIMLGYAISQFVISAPVYFILALSLAIIFTILLVRNLQFGLLAFMFISIIAIGESPGIHSPNSGYKAGLMPSQILLGFMALLWIGRSVLTDRLSLKKTALNLPFGMLASVAFISLIVNNVLSATKEQLFHQLLITQVAEVGLLYFSILAYFMTANIFNDRKWIRLIPVPMVLLSSIYVLHRSTGILLPVAMPWLSLMMAGAISMLYSRLLFWELTPWKKFGLGFILAAILVTSCKDIGWISGFIAAMTAVIVVSFYKSKIVTILIILALMFAMFVYPGVYSDIRAESEAGGDFDRFVIWADAFNMFMAVDPVFGIGPGNYHPYVYYHNTIWFGGQTYTTAHSNYIGIASELGLAGLGVLLWVVIAGIITGNRAVRSAPPDMKWFAIAATAYFIGIATASIFGDYMFPSRGNNGIVNFGATVYVWLVLGAAAAAGKLNHDAGTDTAVS